MTITRLLTLAVMGFGIGCARGPIKNPDQALRPKDEPLAIADDLGWAALVEALPTHIDSLKRYPVEEMRFGASRVRKSEYVRALELLVQEGRAHGPERVAEILQTQFTPHEIYGDTEWGKAFITSYFDPVIPGSARRSGRFTQPLYGLPDDMVVIDVKAFSEAFPILADFGRRVYEQKSREGWLRGRLEKNGDSTRVLPYFSRSEIDTDERLKGRSLELVWVDPVDAFFLQIQGSGTVELERGRKVRVGYAGQNGHPYVPIGKHLFDVIPKEKMSLQTIESHLRGLTPEERQKVMNLNPSYVFFRKLDGPPITHMGAPVVSGRTIATDPLYFPKGALAFLEFDKPQFSSPEATEPASWQRARRVVFDQDTGGAIRGPHRLDLYWGSGSEAKQAAGIVKHPGRLHYLLPKPEFIKRALAAPSGP